MTKFFAEHVPTVAVGREQADLFNMDSQNLKHMQHAVISDTLESAMDFAYKVTGTDQVIIFDGGPGRIECQRFPGRAPGKGRTRSE